MRRSLFLRSSLMLLGVVIVGVLALTWSNRPIPAAAYFEQFERYPLVIAHADDTGLGKRPGNTLPFLAYVADLGVDVLEMDVHMTKDGQIVLIHDARVDRTTNGEGAVSELTLAEIRSLEVGVNWTQDGQSYPYRGQGLQIPTLIEVFERFPSYPMNIEIKQETPSLAEPLCALIRQYNMAEKVIVPSSSDTAIRDFRQACPEVATAPSTSEVRNFVLLNFVFLSGVLRPDYQAFQVPMASGGIPIVRRAFVDAAHRQNIQVHVWTINDRAVMETLIDMGVDGIMTDKPEMLLEMIEAR
jgi:glycerophosphoryl diester phosphodiesterase